MVYSLYWWMIGKKCGEELFYIFDFFLEFNEVLVEICSCEG